MYNLRIGFIYFFHFQVDIFFLIDDGRTDVRSDGQTVFVQDMLVHFWFIVIIVDSNTFIFIWK